MKTLGTSLALCALFSMSGTAQASLLDRGGGLIYDTELDITWLQDANYAKTSGYDADGLMDWNKAVIWAANLSYYDSVRKQTLTDWRLPGMIDVGAPGCNWGYNGTDCGFNVSGAIAEMAHLFYDELGNKGYYSTSGVAPQAGWGLANTGPFSNIQNSYYWYSVEDALISPVGAWAFEFDDGHQDPHLKNGLNSAWAVHKGDVGAVPVPAALWLMGSGLLGMVGVARRKR